MGGLAAAAALAFAPVPAAAQPEVLPDDNAGTGQYIEPVPDAGGDRRATPPGPDGDRRDGGGLPRNVRDALPPGDEGRLLERIATDPGAGAPAGAGSGASQGDGTDGAGRGGSGSGDGPAASGAAGEDDSGAAAVVASTVGDPGSGVGLLLIALVALTVAGGAAALRARGRRS